MKIHRLLQGLGPHRRHPPGRPLPHHHVHRGQLGGRRQPPGQWAMQAALAALKTKTTYNVRVSGYVQATKGGKWVQFKTRTWSFTTA